MTHVTCRLTAQKRDQLQNPTLGNRVWVTFTFTLLLAVGNLHNSAYDSTVLIVTDCDTRSNKIGRVRSSVCPSVRLFLL